MSSNDYVGVALSWVITVAVLFCAILFPYRKKDREIAVGKDELFSVNIDYFRATALILILIVCYGSFYAFCSELNDGGKSSLIREWNYGEPGAFPGSCLMMFAQFLMCSICYFFTGMCAYKNRMLFRRKWLLILPAAVTVITVSLRVAARTRMNGKLMINIRYESIYTLHYWIHYLVGIFTVMAILYTVYIILRKILRNDLIPLIIILILSLFHPTVTLFAFKYYKPYVSILKWGANAPLFPIGMLVMKHKDKLIPKGKRSTVIYTIVCSFMAVLSLVVLFNLVQWAIRIARVPAPHSSGCFLDGYGEARYTAFIERVSGYQCITYLVLGLSLSMLLVFAASRIRMGNKLTGLITEYSSEILIFHFCLYFFFIYTRMDTDLDELAFKYPSLPDYIWPVIVMVVMLLVSVFMAVVFRKLIGNRIDKKIVTRFPVKKKEVKEIVISGRRKRIMIASVLIVAVALLVTSVATKDSSIDGLWESIGSEDKYVAYIKDDIVVLMRLSKNGGSPYVMWGGSIGLDSEGLTTAKYTSSYDTALASVSAGYYRPQSGRHTVMFKYSLGVLTFSRQTSSEQIRFIRSYSDHKDIEEKMLSDLQIYNETDYTPSFSRGRTWIFDYEGMFRHNLVAIEISNKNPYRISVPMICASNAEVDTFRLDDFGSINAGETQIILYASGWDLTSSDPFLSMSVLDDYVNAEDPNDFIEITTSDIRTDSSGAVDSVYFEFTCEESLPNGVFVVLFYKDGDLVGAGYNYSSNPKNIGEDTYSYTIFDISSVTDYDDYEIRMQ